MIVQDWDKIVKQFEGLVTLNSRKEELFIKLLKSIVYEILKENEQLREELQKVG